MSEEASSSGGAFAIRVLSADEAGQRRGELAELLADCVAGGASVGFMWPFSAQDAVLWWDGQEAALGSGRCILFGAFSNDELVGSAQLSLDMPPNQPHRGDVKKVLVHRRARRLGLGRALLDAVDGEARRRRRTLLVLDTATGSDAERLYVRHGWTRSGTIPGYALWPDGRPCATTVMWKRP